MAVKSVVVMAGGTGGHVFPALAVAHQLESHGVRIHWLGTAAGIEADVVPKNRLPITFLDVSGVRGQGIGRLLRAPFKVMAATLAAMRVMRAVEADCVIGLGGYVTGPGGLAARLLGKPLIIHEQNAIAGFTNRMLSRLATQVLQAFPGAFPADPKVATTGNPVRADICAVPAPEERFAGRSGPLRVLVLGGSQGAVALNALLPKALAQLSPDMRPELRHQTGRKSVESTQANYEAVGVTAEVVPFIDDMAAAYAWADLVICRSGALTVSELAAVGAASILVPYPFAVDDHQTANARYLSEAGAACLCPQKILTPEVLAAELRAVWNRDTLLNMAVKARQQAKPEATATVAAFCLQPRA
ncbi:MAG: undecaprenyldiphospho-muramoylpentapeptide beta-N-acetylglucosaminyltransferase [Fluviicoccus sp.]|uniref:undecaprenyldiphospho-muramoylpentapeptide beta-N-acetylglucosaminyltransferase n=1 Tax=Fluviicoccus sp. TaxID=2003552 RepID=UPI002726B23F|nr:undecaprenyldiphospho-muramoylpentapeptide beta-N-acetylglucosaminyltransferase [Fluviicoccus sp.]MDO8330006.1 undecaprenyldiphospho-muramoylpentapeptide beta-N-acetylglucosaminyltransferase [Fluviicoccus sp.]